jgi:hypothetical protein
VQHLIFEATFLGFFRIILIAFAVYYLLSLVLKYLLPQLIKHTVRTIYEQNGNTEKKEQKKEGEMTIEYIDEKTKRTDTSPDDEYVDFEEIK